MNYTDVFYELIRRGFGHGTAYQLTVAHMAHVTGYTLQTARMLLSDRLTFLECKR